MSPKKEEKIQVTPKKKSVSRQVKNSLEMNPRVPTAEHKIRKERSERYGKLKEVETKAAKGKKAPKK